MRNRRENGNSRVGLLSLLVVSAGFLTTGSALYCRWASGAWLEILCVGFEAGTIGALADWYAVSALFRRLGPHSDIIRRKREDIQNGIVDMVVNKWLTSEAIAEHVMTFSPSAILIERARDATTRKSIALFIGAALSKTLDAVDTAWAATFLEKEIRGRLREADFARPLGTWLGKAVEAGEIGALWARLSGAAAAELTSPEARDAFAETLKTWLGKNREILLAQFDRPETLAFIETALREKATAFDLGGPLGRAIGDAARSGGLDWLIALLLESAAKHIRQDNFRSFVADRIDTLIRNKAETFWFPALAEKGAKLLIDPWETAQRLIETLSFELLAIKPDKANVIREALIALIADFGSGLARESGKNAETLEKIKMTVAEKTDWPALAKTLSTLAKNEISRSIGEDDGLFDINAVAATISALLAEWLRRAGEKPEDPVRLRLERLVSDFAEKLQTGAPEAVGPLNGLAERLAASVELRPVLETEMERLRATLKDQLSREDSAFVAALEKTIARLPETLAADASYREKLDETLRAALIGLVKTNHGTLEDILRRSLGKLDDDRLVAQLKSRTWNDLQYIRLNGAVVGFLIGLALGLAKLALARAGQL